MIQKLCNNFASERGFIRYLLAECEASLARLSEFQEVDFDKVERLVFVCLGNICRSPFGEFIAMEHKIDTAGFGIATSTGQPAFDLAMTTAKKFNIDLSTHRTTAINDFTPLDTDLMLVMEVRHARRLKNILTDSNAQIALLGNWAKPRRLHIHDPHTHDAVYFENCYKVIKSATENLVSDYLHKKNRQSFS